MIDWCNMKLDTANKVKFHWIKMESVFWKKNFFSLNYIGGLGSPIHQEREYVPLELF